MTGKADLAASIAGRLLNRAKATGEDYQTLLTSYCLERFLYQRDYVDARQVLYQLAERTGCPERLAEEAGA